MSTRHADRRRRWRWWPLHRHHRRAARRHRAPARQAAGARRDAAHRQRRILRRRQPAPARARHRRRPAAPLRRRTAHLARQGRPGAGLDVGQRPGRDRRLARRPRLPVRPGDARAHPRPRGLLGAAHLLGRRPRPLGAAGAAGAADAPAGVRPGRAAPGHRRHRPAHRFRRRPGHRGPRAGPRRRSGSCTGDAVVLATGGYDANAAAAQPVPARALLLGAHRLPGPRHRRRAADGPGARRRGLAPTASSCR